MADSSDKVVTDRSVPAGAQRRMHRVLVAALLASALPTGAWAQDAVDPAPAPNPTGTALEDGSGAFGEGLGSLPLPPVTFSVFVDLAEGYRFSNDATGSAGDDSFTRGRAGFALHYDKPRLKADASYDLTGEYWGKFHRLNHLSQRLALDSQLTVIPEMLFVNASAFATPTELTRIGSVSASGQPLSRYNSRDSYGYMVRPEFRLRFKDYATSTLSASHGGVFFVRPSTDNTGTPPPITPASNGLSTTVSEQLKSGTYFGRLEWSLVGTYGQFSQTVRTQRVVEGLANLTYALTRAFRVFATGGYSEYKSTMALTKNLSGPTGLGGVTYTPTPEIVLTVEAGTQQNFPVYMGSARWSISPLTEFTAQATDMVSTPQNSLLSRLGNGGAFGGTGGLGGVGGGIGGLGSIPGVGNIGGSLGLGSYGGYSPYSSHGLALDNSLYRMRNIEGSLVHHEDRTRYILSLFGSERDRLDAVAASTFNPRSSVYGVRGTVTHQLPSGFSVLASAGFSRAFEFGGHDNILSADANLSYHLSQTIQLYLSDHFIHRTSANLIAVPNRALTEDQVLIGIRASF